MKNLKQESKRRRIRQYHRNHLWRLSSGGLFIPHAYSEPRELSWWDDVGFILNGRRVMVWWVHPRMKYADAIEDAAWAEAGEPPSSINNSFDSGLCTNQYMRQGRSRKKVVAYRVPPTASDTAEYFSRLETIQNRIEAEGIDMAVRPSISIKMLDWCIGIELCIPHEVRNAKDLLSLTNITRQILVGRASLALAATISDDYRYDRKQWLTESWDRQVNRDRLTRR